MNPMKAIRYATVDQISSFRKLSVGAWQKPNDPTTNVQLDVDVSHVLTYLEKHSEISFKVFLIKCFSQVLHDIPEINRVMIRRTIRQRLDNRVFVPVVFKNKGQMDLNGVSLDNAYTYSLSKLQQYFQMKINQLKSFEDKPIKWLITVLNWVPSFLCIPLVRLFGKIQYSLNISLALFGMPADRFGSMSITFLGGFGIRYAAVPLFPLSRSLITIAVGTIHEEREIKMLPLTVSFDHRCFDGLEGHKAFKRLKRYMLNPHLLEKGAAAFH